MNNSIVFLGTEGDQTSIECLSGLLENRFNVVAVVSLKERKNKIRKRITFFVKQIISNGLNNNPSLKKITKNNKISYIQLRDINSSRSIDYLKRFAPDLMCVCIFSKILKRKIIEIPRYGTINMHPSMLPNYKGSDPYFWVLKNAEKETGVTIHYIDEGIDTGDIILQKPYFIPEGIDIIELKKELSRIASFLMVKAIHKIVEKRVTRQKQGSGSKFPSPDVSDFIIDPNMNVRYIFNLIKGIKSMGPIFRLGNKKILIKDVLKYELCSHNRFPNYEIQKGNLIFYAIDGIIIFSLISSKDKLIRYFNNLPFSRIFQRISTR